LKRLFFILQLSLFIVFNFFLLLSVYQFMGNKSNMQRLTYDAPVYDQREEFDPALSNLNSLQSLLKYCDSVSLLNPAKPALSSEKNFTEMAAAVVRKRFYHGYSLYGFSNNYMAMMMAQMLGGGLSAIVVPDDILKYPYAACSQQSIVMMQLLEKRGIKTRKVGFTGNATGHFCFEAYYDNGWHYFDPDKEPDAALLASYNRPSIDWLNQHKDVLVAAYPQYSKDYVLDVFTKYSYGQVSAFPAPRALLFQQGAKILSYTIWIFFLAAFILARKKYKKLAAATQGKKMSRRPSLQTAPIPMGLTAA
jgi:hypothetical protein